MNRRNLFSLFLAPLLSLPKAQARTCNLRFAPLLDAVNSRTIGKICPGYMLFGYEVWQQLRDRTSISERYTRQCSAGTELMFDGVPCRHSWHIAPNAVYIPPTAGMEAIVLRF